MMQFLMDENVPPAYREQLLRRLPDVMIWAVGQPGVPAKGALDPDVLAWCEARDCLLVTNNRRSMPGHLAERLQQQRHVPGILVLRPDADFGRVVDDLALIAQAGWEGDFTDLIRYVPL